MRENKPMNEEQRGRFNGEPVDVQEEQAPQEAGTLAAAGANKSEGPEIISQNLAEELEQERARSSEYLDQAQRTRAELINYRRRMEQEMQSARRFAAESLIARILPVIDDFHRANDSVPAEEQDNAWVQGMRLIERKMWQILESEGVRPIDAIGKPFDPSIHEAVSVAEDGGDTVVEEFQRGYTMHDRTIRPAMVKVGRARDGQQNGKA